VPPVNEYRKLDKAGAAEVDQSIHSRPRAASRVQDVINQDYRLAVDIDRDIGTLDNRLLVFQRVPVVTVQTDIESTDRQFDLLVARDIRRQAIGQRHTPGTHPHHDNIIQDTVPLDNLMGDPGDSAPDVLGGHDYLC